MSEFTCPQCGSHDFGSTNCTGPGPMTRHCHGDGCRFTFPEADDEKYGLGRVADARSTADLIAERGYRVVGTCTAREAAELRVRIDVLEETVGKLVAHVALLEEKAERRPAPLERIAFE